MTATALIEELNKLGVTLTPEGDRLHYRGPAAVMTLELKQQIAERKTQIIATLTKAERVLPGLKNEVRPVSDQCAEALELRGELNNYYNERAAILEYDAHFPRAEAERLAMIETKATQLYPRWKALNWAR
jgi:hypothetical protein